MATSSFLIACANLSRSAPPIISPPTKRTDRVAQHVTFVFLEVARDARNDDQGDSEEARSHDEPECEAQFPDRKQCGRRPCRRAEGERGRQLAPAHQLGEGQRDDIAQPGEQEYDSGEGGDHSADRGSDEGKVRFSPDPHGGARASWIGSFQGTKIGPGTVFLGVSFRMKSTILGRIAAGLKSAAPLETAMKFSASTC
jgi:hypothetical protein